MVSPVSARVRRAGPRYEVRPTKDTRIMPHVAAGSATLAYEEAGPADADTILLSNSIGATHHMWARVVPLLADRYRVIAYDTRGHGASPVIPGPVSTRDLAGDMLGLLGALGIDRAHIVGLSLGGMAGMEAALAAPERILSLTLMASSAHVPPAATWAERAATVRAHGMAALADAVMNRWFSRGFAERAPEIVAATRAHFSANDPEGYALCCGAIGGMDLRSALPRIATPTLVMTGRGDTATSPAMAEELAANIPRAELILLPDAAHMLSLEQPEAAAGYLSAFLDRHPA